MLYAFCHLEYGRFICLQNDVGEMYLQYVENNFSFFYELYPVCFLVVSVRVFLLVAFESGVYG